MQQGLCDHLKKSWAFRSCRQIWTPGLVQIPVSMYQTVVTSLAQGNGPVQVAMAPVAARITDSTVTMDGQAVEVVTLEQ
uniref:GTPase regulator Nrf1 n=1 Tax=Sphaerodactylus townsendi TaxID=933632 RepID=A0ACB8FLE8_9SAUR